MRIPVLLFLVSAVLNVVSWGSRTFSDWYADGIFRVASAPLAWFSDLFPFSIGEWMLGAAVLWVAVLAVVLAVLLAWTLLRKRPRDSSATRTGAGQKFLIFRRSAGRFAQATGWIASVVFLVMTLNCVILYHVTPLEESLPGYGREYSVDELASLRDYIAEQCNELAEIVPRDGDGEVRYAGGYGAMAQKAREEIEREELTDGERIPALRRLKGRSVTPKALLASGFVSQQYMQGYYFPFSMEANYNSVMKIMNVPFTMCHELSHTHGFIYEDEANLIGFLACIHSDDPVFRYSGWLGVLNYVNNSFYENVDQETYLSHVRISEQVLEDNEFLSDAAWEDVEKNAVVSTETVKAAADAYLDNTLKANGIGSGKASYSHVVGLLLEYYDGALTK